MLTLVMPYYRNPGMLALQMGVWAAWPAALKAEMRIVIVDDGSPEPAAEVRRPDGLPALGIWRVREDKPWHQHGARNLGAHVASDGWLLLTDMDHVLPERSAAALVAMIDADQFDAGTVYMLDRVEAGTGARTVAAGRPKPHPNSFVLTREMFWRIGGYDEDFCGVYGTDSLFRARAFAMARRGQLTVPLVRYWRDLVPDASTTTLPRKEGRPEGAKQAVLDAKAARGEAGVVKTLQFAWDQVL